MKNETDQKLETIAAELAGELSHRVSYHLPIGAADALTQLDELGANMP